MPEFDLSDVIAVEAAWSDGPWAVTPTWSDITTDCYEVGFGQVGGYRGFDAGAGEGALRLRNLNGQYDTDNPGSTLPAGAIRKGRPIRVVASRQDVADTEVLFYGYLTNLTPTSSGTNDNNVAVASIEDGLGVLARYPLEDLERPAEWTGQRVVAILDEIGWPAHLRGTIQNGTVWCDAATITQTALAAINEMQRAEGGFFWCDGAGRLQWRNRFEIIERTEWSTNQFNFVASNPAAATDNLAAEPIPSKLAQFENFERWVAVAKSGRTLSSQGVTTDFPPESANVNMRAAVFDADATTRARHGRKSHDYSGQRPDALPALVYPNIEDTGATATDSQVLVGLVANTIDMFNRVNATYTPRGNTAAVNVDLSIVGWEHNINYAGGWGMRVFTAPYSSSWTTESADFYTFGTATTANSVPGI